MPRQFGKVDVSASWTRCPRCPAGHPSHSPCPPVGVWLVLALCHRCNPKTGAYCNRHRDRIADADPIQPPTDDVQMLRIGGDA